MFSDSEAVSGSKGEKSHLIRYSTSSSDTSSTQAEKNPLLDSKEVASIGESGMLENRNSERGGTVAGQNRVITEVDGPEDNSETKQQLENKQKARVIRSDHRDENSNQIEDRVRVDSGNTLDADNRKSQLAPALDVNETVGDLEKRNSGLFKDDTQNETGEYSLEDIDQSSEKTKASTVCHCQPAGIVQKAQAIPLPPRDQGETENRNSHFRERGEPGDETGRTGGNILVNGNSSGINVDFGTNNVFNNSRITFITHPQNPPNTVPSCNVSQQSARPSRSEQSDTERLPSDESLNLDHGTDISSNIATDDLEVRGFNVPSVSCASQPSGSSKEIPTARVRE